MKKSYVANMQPNANAKYRTPSAQNCTKAPQSKTSVPPNNPKHTPMRTKPCPFKVFGDTRRMYHNPANVPGI